MGRIARVAIEQRRPWRTALGVLVLGAVLGAGGYTLYLREVEPLRVRAEVLAGKLAAARRERRELTDRAAGLRSRLARAERALQVEREAGAELEQRLGALQEQILGLERQVAFYRDIVGPRPGAAVRVQTFVLWPEDGSTYRYQVVLTRGRNDGKVVKGAVRLVVAGEQDGRTRRLAMDALTSGGVAALDFSFRYFQRLEGRLELPAGFVPRVVTVEVVQAGRSRRVARDFDWPVAAG